MAQITNFEETTYNDDGSVTTRIEYTELPATKKEKAIAWTVLSGVVLVSLAPIWLTVHEEYKWRRQERKDKKAAEKRIAEMQENIKI